MRRFLGMAGLTLALALAGCSEQPAGETNSVVIGIQNSLSFLPFHVMAAEKLIEKEAEKRGFKLEADIRNLGSAGIVRDALIAGNIQFAVAGPPTLITMHDKTSGDIKAVTAVVGLPMWLNTTNPDINGICDFTEKDKIALPTMKSSVQAVALQMAAEKECGSAFALDRFTVTQTHPDGYNNIMNGIISSHMTTPPYSYAEVEKGNGKVRTVFDSNKFFNGSASVLYLIASDKFRAASPKAYQAVRAAMDAAMAFIKAHPEAAADIYLKAEKTGETREEILRIIQSPEVTYTTTPIGLGDYANFMAKIGTVKRAYSWKELSMPDLHGLKGT